MTKHPVDHVSCPRLMALACGVVMTPLLYLLLAHSVRELATPTFQR